MPRTSTAIRPVMIAAANYRAECVDAAGVEVNIGRKDDPYIPEEPPVDVVHSVCGLPSSAEAFIFNATIVPASSPIWAIDALAGR